MPRRIRREKQTIVDPRLLLDYYDAWLRTDKVHEVCAVLGVARQNLNDWPRKYPEFALAKKLADERREKGRGSLRDYVYKRLSDEAKEAWDELQWEGRNGTANALKKFMEPLTKEVRQELFLHALVTNHFDVSTACNVVGMSLSGLQWWREHDPEFLKLFKEMFEHRNNFFEKQLTTLVELGHPGAVIFVNETINADRGYRRNVKVEHSGQIDNGGFDFEALDLSMETRLEILDAIRRKKLGQGPKQLKEGSVDAELVTS